MDKNKTYYETQSLLLATTLVSLEVPLDSLVKSQDKKFVFIFLRTDQLDQTLENFWQKRLRIEPNSFWEAQRFLKSRIYGG